MSSIPRSFRAFHPNSFGDTNSSQDSLLWVSTSLKYFDLPLLKILNKNYTVARWEYQQGLDEASSLVEAVNLLVNYLKQCDRPIHLAGHGISGVVAMYAAERVPEYVKTLTLLGVASQPGLTWHAHYYLHRLTTPCSQTRVLAQFARELFGSSPHSIKTLVNLLQNDLASSPSPHSLFNIAKLDPVKLQVPLLLCGGESDFVVSPEVMQTWTALMKSGDRVLQVPDGRHFFHYHFPDQVAIEMIQFLSQKTAFLTPVYSR